MPVGLIVKALSGYYYVLPDANSLAQAAIIQCKARGIFKKNNESPLVGDKVRFEFTENGEGMVEQIFPRTSELIRPPIANVDLVLLVFSVDEPALNLQLLDKFLVHTQKAGLKTMICFSKLDLAVSGDQAEASRSDQSEVANASRLYRKIGYEVLNSSAKTNSGTKQIMERLTGHISVFSGQSGVGKSSLLNAMMPELKLQTNIISQKLGRGKHTTRHVELIPLPGGGFVADSPGFSQLDFTDIEAEELGHYFIEMNELSAECKFRGCSHRHEPGCKVIAAKEAGNIAASRYAHYLQFLEEIRERKRRY